MNTTDLLHLGIPEGDAIKLAHSHMRRLFAQGHDRAAVEAAFSNILADPVSHTSDPDSGEFARILLRPHFTPRADLAPWRQWGTDLEPDTIKQMANACALPVAVAGALMPDAHVGYGLPIGGVLATENAVIPYAVGVDIACRMKLTVYDRKANIIPGQRDRLANILESETRFGIGAEFKDRHDHDVMDDDWTVSPVTNRLRDKAWKQLIHKHIAKKVGAKVILDIENHHNFAWKERHVVDGHEKELIVHRKGATPAGKGVLGIIPGSMATPGFLVRGKGQPASLHSASHGAGRVMSRTKALRSFTWSGTRKLLKERGVDLLSAGLDEVPGVYKDIHTVMAAQSDLVDVLARFDPKLVKMSPPGERAED